MNILKRLTSCGFLQQCDDIPVVKGAYKWPVRVIGERSVAQLLFLCKTMNPGFV